MRKSLVRKAALLCLFCLVCLSAPILTRPAAPIPRRDLWLVTATLRETVTTTAQGYWKITTPNTNPSKLFPMKEITIEKKNRREYHKSSFAGVTAVMENEGGDGVLVFSDRDPVSIQVGGSIDEYENTERLEYANGELGRGSSRDVRESRVQVSGADVQMEWSDEVKGIGIGSWGKGTSTTRFELYDYSTGAWKTSSTQGERSDSLNLGGGEGQEGSSCRKIGNTYHFSTLFQKTEHRPKNVDYDETTITTEHTFIATVKPYNPPEVRILMVKNGQEEDITDRTVDVVAGELVDLKTLILPENKKEEGPMVWTISGGGASGKNYLKKFEADKAHGRVVYPEKADLEQKTLRFYWSGGENGSVTYTTKVEGESASARAGFKIRKPNIKVTVTPAPGSHFGKLDKGGKLNDTECWVTPAYAPGTSSGVQYDGINFSCEPLDSKTPGKYQWVQIIKKESSRQKFANGAWADFVITDALDMCYPYQSGLKAKDAPAVVVPADKDRQDLVFFSKTQTSRMVLMFKPEGQDSEWIPMQFIDWEWQGAAQYYDTPSNPHWEMEAAATNEPQGVTPQPTEQYPEWTKNSGDDSKFQQIDK